MLQVSRASERIFFMEWYVMTIIWAVVFVAALWVEAETAELVALWFTPSALVSLTLSFCKVEWWIQCIVFVALSAVLLVFAKTVLKKHLQKHLNQEKTDTDLLIGEIAVVTERIDNNDMSGAVKIQGKIWSARMNDDCETAEVGEFVEVLAISGVKLICRWK